MKGRDAAIGLARGTGIPGIAREPTMALAAGAAVTTGPPSGAGPPDIPPPQKAGITLRSTRVYK